MNYKRKTAAFVSGALMSCAVACLSAYLPSLFRPLIPIPPRFYDNDLLVLSFAALNMAVMVLPIFFLSWAWSSTTFRWLARPKLTTIYWVLGGVVVGMLLWELGSEIRWYYSWLDMKAEMDRKVQAGIIHSWGPRNRTFWDFVYAPYWIFYFWNNPVLLAILSGLAATAATTLRSKRPPNVPLAQTSPHDASEASASNDQPGHTPFVRAGATT